MRIGVLIATTALAIGGMPAAAGEGSPRDLQAIIDAAAPGSVLTLEPGVYAGNVSIDKPLTIDGGGEATIDAGGEGNGVDVASADVTLRRLTIRNTGDSLDRENAGVSSRESARLVVENCTFESVLFGVFARQSPDSVIRDNVIGAMDLEPGRRGDAIRVWEAHGSTISGNVVDGGRDSVMWYSDDLLVEGNRFVNGRYGLHLMYSHDATIRGNVLEGNSVGAFLMYTRNLVFTGNFVAGSFGPSGYGLGMKEVDGAMVSGNRFVANRVGIYFDYTPISYDITQRFTDNLIAYNQIGLLFLPNVERNEFSGNAFIENREQVGITGSGEFTGNSWTIDGVGNHWDDFGGYDADGDGKGDIAYELDDLYSSLIDSHPELAFFTGTPAARAVDLAAQVFPTLRPRPKVVDEAPLVNVPEFPPAPRGVSSTTPIGLLGVSLALLAAASTIVALAQRRIGYLR